MYGEALEKHRLILRGAFNAHGGVEVDTQGDAFFVAFPTAQGALAAAQEVNEALAQGPVRVRIGIHTGTPLLREEGYVGMDVHRAARIAAAGHGGQVLLSKETRELVGGGLTDLGEHRLKDFEAPAWIFQLGSERFPPLKTISNTNLPRPASSFVGRERETGEVTALLQDGARLVTLSGPGGSGKTRLAIEAASDLVPEFKAGVFWVGLAPLRDAALVFGEISETLGAKDSLAEHIGDRELLLLLDNLEQVVEAAPELGLLLEACPNLKLLATSRELLRIRGEVEYAVPPLTDDEAVALFCERAQAEADETTAELCRRLDNLPLALELAAARTSVLSPKQILERLSKRLDLLKGGRDAEARQQTLRATIEWSHDLLSSEEQELFRRLSVFAGGCTLDAAEEVADADLDVLQSLIDKSLLRQSGERFSMLETIRDYAAERLDEPGLAHRHAEWFLALAEEAEPRLYGHAESRELLDRLELEYDNVRAALDHMHAAGEGELELRLAGALWAFWRDRAYLAEGRRRLERALAGDERPTPARGKALIAASSLASNGGDAASGRVLAEAALSLHRSLRDEAGIGKSEMWLAWALANEGEWGAALPLFENSVRRAKEMRDEDETLVATMFLAIACAELGDRQRSRALDEENLQRAQRVRNEQIEATTLDGLARHALDDGRLDEALARAVESLRLYHKLGDPHGVAIELRRSAHAIALKGGAQTAVRLLAAAEVLSGELGGTMAWEVRITEDALASVREQVDQGAITEGWQEGGKLTSDEAVALALSEAAADA